MKALILISIFSPIILFGQNLPGHTVSKLKNGNGIKIEYGTALMGYLLKGLDDSQGDKITAIIEYKNNMRNGRRIQFFHYPYDTASVEYYKNDTLDGPFFYRYKNGNLWQKGIYIKGVLDKIDYWSEQGIKFSDNITYNDGNHLFYSNDSLCNGEKVVSCDNAPIGVAHIYFDNGKIDSINSFGFGYWGVDCEIKRNYLDSSRKFLTYYEGGNLDFIYSEKIVSIYPNKFSNYDGEVFFTDKDKLVDDGRFTTFYNNNKHSLKEEVLFRNGSVIGNWTFYSEKGTIDSTWIYRKGVRIKTIKD